MKSKKVAIIQSNYIPWKGYFDIINQVDEFILYDDVQYTRRDWRNRNKIKTPNGLQWLTIPVEVKGKYNQKIKDTKISEFNWAKKHWRTIEMNYSKAPYFSELGNMIYDRIYACDWKFLGDLSITYIELIINYLGITQKTYRSSQLKIISQGNQKLVDICKHVGAKSFLVKPNTENYHPREYFKENGISFVYLYILDLFFTIF